MDYINDTREAFRNSLKAKIYKEQYTKGTKWSRFTMWRIRRCTRKALDECNLTNEDSLLDIPCGTGLLLKVFNKYPTSNYGADISLEMMNYAREEDFGKNKVAFTQCNITRSPFKESTFDCVLTIGLMHRVPADIKEKVLKEINSLSKKYVIVSYTLDSPTQRVKQWLIKKIISNHIPAPAPDSLKNIINAFEANKLIVKRTYRYVYLFCAQNLFLLEKK